MRSEIVLVLFLLSSVAFCDSNDVSYSRSQLEARGKKKKIALWIYFADLVVKKVFVLKLIYAFVLWCVIHKAGYFLAWFVGYLKQKKQEHHDHDHYGPHHHYDHDHPPYGYGPSHHRSFMRKT